MPLSEQEQRLLEEMERSLYHNDADYVAGAGGRRGKPTYSRIGLGILLGMVGVAVLITGVGVQLPVIGVVGFALMFVGVLLALTPARNGAGRPANDSNPAESAKPESGSFLQNLGDRFDNRSDDRDE